uniref:U1-hexatoxin-Iw1e n=1 Tax=Illawarra wisharti TaxID=278061 RepID=T7496_ILLWI|nr:RecName: Full=U1-hexatoxin-Iw1e; Short=U1-HXTX-Iw1e; AltName: Full=Atracotoxin-Hs20f7496; Short=AcTx-Hs20f7496; Flags: Precursor [Hadronyche sp. 20]AAX11344.1 ACTX-Hs20f7496 precursor [Hadronyche sp. 20]
MLKFVVLIFVVIMASTFAEQCGDKVCGEGTCCSEFPVVHCRELGIVDDLCMSPGETTDSGRYLFFCPCETGLRCDKNDWTCKQDSSRSE